MVDEFPVRLVAPTLVCMHQPPFDTGVRWMDCIGLGGREGFEAVVRRHLQVKRVVAGHVHRAVQQP